MELGLDLFQRLVEVAHQRAADAAGGHLADLDAGFLQKAAVDADLAELIFNQNQLLTGECLRQQLFDEGRFARAQKAGDNVNFRHGIKSFSQNFMNSTYDTTKMGKCNQIIKNSQLFPRLFPDGPAGLPAHGRQAQQVGPAHEGVADVSKGKHRPQLQPRPQKGR